MGRMALLPAPLERGRAIPARHFLLAMLASGGVPGPHLVRNETYQGSMFGVHVHCVMYDLDPYQWADVALTGGVFGSRGVSGKAWREFEDHTQPDLPTIKLDRVLEKQLRRYHVSLISVDQVDTTEHKGGTLMLQLVLPMVGRQRMVLMRVSERAYDRWCEL